jgi:hypothetical protein
MATAILAGDLNTARAGSRGRGPPHRVLQKTEPIQLRVRDFPLQRVARAA